MPIVIKTEKVVTGDSKLSRKILEISALRKNELPDIYLKGLYCYYDIHHNRMVIYNNGIYYIYIGDTYSEKEFQKQIEMIKKAGENLKTCNKILAALRAEWNGQEDFSI